MRKALKAAATAAGCDFLGFGLHSLRRAKITRRQEVGVSAIEASKIAGHGTVSQTGDYTIVQLQRQDELTRAIQKRLGEAVQQMKDQEMANGIAGTAQGALSPNGTHRANNG